MQREGEYNEPRMKSAQKFKLIAKSSTNVTKQKILMCFQISLRGHFKLTPFVLLVEQNSIDCLKAVVKYSGFIHVLKVGDKIFFTNNNAYNSLL